MKPRIVFATGNQNKLSEVDKVLGDFAELISLKDVGHFDELEETQETLEGNALQKARFIKNHYGLDCFSEDTGLEVEAINGEPGIYAARYAGEAKDHNANMDKLIAKLGENPNRKARFRTVIALIMEGKEYLFEGEVKGEILKEKRGKKGFGYDPVFSPEGYDVTFAEMDLETKNTISHRSKAVLKLKDFLQNYSNSKKHK